MYTIRIWDLPTRLFHWTLASAVICLVITGQTGGDAMVWHFRLGYAVLTLLVFRLLWGLVGGHWSRWRHLPLSPASVRAYLHGDAQGHLTAGHSPTGAWAVIVLLGLTTLQALTGLFSDDEIANAGPLTVLVNGDLVARLTSWHKGPGKWILLGMVSLHLAAIVWYRYRKHTDLIRPMLSGDKQLPTPLPASRDGLLDLALALCCLGLAALFVRWLIQLGG